MMLKIHSLTAILALSSLGLTTPIKDIKRQTIQDEYDLVICGGGTAGLVLANRLSESGSQRVLVLEAGPNPEVVAAYETPGGNQFLGGTAIDWNFYTQPQEHLNDRILPYHRGRGLGGSSATNGMFYGRGSSSVYDQWARIGNPGWEWETVWPLFVKSTHLNPPDEIKGFDMSFKTWDPASYAEGPLEIGFQGYVPESGVGFIKASSEALSIPIVHDLNSGNGTGVKQGTGIIDSHMRRSSSYDGFYKQAANRPNLDVLHYAPVQSIISDTSGDMPVVTGVSFMDHPTGLIHTIKARKEVILAMGAFHSPQLLMVSGFGPASELEQFGITPVLVNENIGRNLNDHSVFSIMATVDTMYSTTDMSAHASSIRTAQDEYYHNGTGPYTAPSGITNAFQKLSEAELETIGATEIIKQGLANQSHIEYLYESIWYPGGPTPYYVPKANESYISLTAQSTVALSRGNITLRSATMADAPVINPNYYADITDRIIAIHSFKYLRKILSNSNLSRFTIGPNNGEVSPGPDINDDDEDAIFEYVKAITIPNWHCSGTIQMRPLEDGGVVDARLKVYGAEGLRVVDSSIIPILPDVNIMGPVVMIAEKGAQMIKEDYSF